MKKKTIYILLMLVMGLGVISSCSNDKDFYIYSTPDNAGADEVPYVLTLSVKMSAADLARINKATGTLSGVTAVAAGNSTATRAENKNIASFDFTINAANSSVDANIKVMGTVKGEKNVLTIAMTHMNGNTTVLSKEVTDKLSDLNHLTADEPLDLFGAVEITLPGGADSAVGGGSLDDWDNSEEGGEAGREF